MVAIHCIVDPLDLVVSENLVIGLAFSWSFGGVTDSTENVMKPGLHDESHICLQPRSGMADVLNSIFENT